MKKSEVRTVYGEQRDMTETCKRFHTVCNLCTHLYPKEKEDKTQLLLFASVNEKTVQPSCE